MKKVLIVIALLISVNIINVKAVPTTNVQESDSGSRVNVDAVCKYNAVVYHDYALDTRYYDNHLIPYAWLVDGKAELLKMDVIINFINIKDKSKSPMVRIDYVCGGSDHCNKFGVRDKSVLYLLYSGDIVSYYVTENSGDVGGLVDGIYEHSGSGLVGNIFKDDLMPWDKWGKTKIYNWNHCPARVDIYFEGNEYSVSANNKIQEFIFSVTSDTHDYGSKHYTATPGRSHLLIYYDAMNIDGDDYPSTKLPNLVQDTLKDITGKDSSSDSLGEVINGNEERIKEETKNASSEPNPVFNFCHDSGVLKIMKVVGIVKDIAKILVPIILIIMASIDFGKAAISGDDKDMKASVSASVKRIIAGIIVFFIPTIVDVVLVNVSGAKDLDYSNKTGNSNFAYCAACFANPIGDKCSRLIEAQQGNSEGGSYSSGGRSF